MTKLDKEAKSPPMAEIFNETAVPRSVDGFLSYALSNPEFAMTAMNVLGKRVKARLGIA